MIDWEKEAEAWKEACFKHRKSIGTLKAQLEAEQKRTARLEAIVNMVADREIARSK